MAKRKFKIEGTWHTWIDYEKFHDLVASNKPFSSMDYIAPTPDWAIYGDDRQGFDPAETRHYRKNRKIVKPDNNNTTEGSPTEVLDR